MSAGIGAADAAIYTGICLENVDPTGHGRIRYCVPQLSGTQSFGWAQPVYPGVTAVGAQIYVAFEGGDRNRPLFWPDQTVPQYVPPALSYPTYAAMVAANPIASTPVGTEFYVVDHGGNIQLQNTGITSTSLGWQWLPSGYQGQSVSNSNATGTGSTAGLITSMSLNNPSAKRVYRVTVDANVWSNGTQALASIGIYTSTTSPPSTIAAFTTPWALTRQASVGNNQAGTAGNTATSLHFATTVTTLPTGSVYVAAYVINSWNNSAISSAGTGTLLLVEDIGANT